MPEGASLRVVARCVVLDADLAHTLVGRGVGELVVAADQVRVSGEFALPGGRLQVACRELLGADGVVDVSGRTPQPPWGDAPAASGVPAAVDGQAGQDGLPGMPGGTLCITCERVVSAPRLLACGSLGGDSQAGGDGARPQPPAAARDGVFNKDKDGGSFGGRVLKKFGLSYFLSVTYGEKGHRGANGGNGGPPGRPGAGGDGGSIHLRVVQAVAGDVLMRVDPAAAGTCGAGGKAGKGGAGGPGGRNRLYRYEWFKKTVSPLLDSRSADVVAARKTYHLDERAATGPDGSDGSGGPVHSVAADGKPGVATGLAATPADLAQAFDGDYLQQASAWADRALERGQTETAQAILRWALALLDAGAAPDDAKALRGTLEQRLTQGATRAAVVDWLARQD